MYACVWRSQRLALQVTCIVGSLRDLAWETASSSSPGHSAILQLFILNTIHLPCLSRDYPKESFASHKRLSRNSILQVLLPSIHAHTRMRRLPGNSSPNKSPRVKSQRMPSILMLSAGSTNWRRRRRSCTRSQRSTRPPKPCSTEHAHTCQVFRCYKWYVYIAGIHSGLTVL